MKKALDFIWRVLRSNILLKVMALFFAVILWSYVLSEIDPPRVRWVPDIKVSYGVEELKAKGLDVSGNLVDALDSVDVRVEVNQSNIKYLTPERVRAYIDWSTVNGPGEYTLDVRASVAVDRGQVLEVSPSTVQLHVSSYETRTVPVNVKVTGGVPSGYFAMIPEISPGVVTISGASEDVEKVSSAECSVDLNGLTEGYNMSVSVQLLDADGDEVDGALFDEGQPSVIVNLKVLATKLVSVDVRSAIMGQDELAAGYEIASISTVPDKVLIAGDADDISAISSIGLTPYSVSGASTSVAVLLDYQSPSGVTVLTEGKAEVYVEIRPIMETKDYSGIDIEARNLADGLSAQLSVNRTDVTVMASMAQLSRLRRSDIVPYVDLEGLGKGRHTLTVLFEIPEGYAAENFSAAAGTVDVTIY